jgi:hypothetical protein
MERMVFEISAAVLYIVYHMFKAWVGEWLHSVWWMGSVYDYIVSDLPVDLVGIKSSHFRRAPSLLAACDKVQSG